MATAEERAELRRITGEADENSPYTDATLDTYIADAGSNLNAAAARIWNEKAAAYADLVDITEAGSSRKNSDLYSRAWEQFKFYDAKAGGDAEAPATYSTTRAIVRP